MKKNKLKDFLKDKNFGDKETEIVSARFLVGGELIEVNYEEALSLAVKMCEVYKRLLQDIALKKYAELPYTTTENMSYIRYVGPDGAIMEQELEEIGVAKELTSKEKKEKHAAEVFGKQPKIVIKKKKKRKPGGGRKPGSKNKKK